MKEAKYNLLSLLNPEQQLSHHRFFKAFTTFHKLEDVPIENMLFVGHELLATRSSADID